MYCKHCGFELQEDVNYCPACGKLQSAPVERETPEAPQPEPVAETSEARGMNRFCIIGFSLSCASFLFTLFGLTALAGQILSVIGLCQLSTQKARGKGFAIAGIFLATFSFILLGLTLFIVQQLIASGELDQLFPSELWRPSA